MINHNSLDIRCVLLCKSFQSQRKQYEKMYDTLNKEMYGRVSHYITLGEFDSIFTFQLDNGNNIFNEITNCNKSLSKSTIESFYKPLYLIIPQKAEIKHACIEDFWQNESAFFFVSTVHTNSCCIDFDYKKKEITHLNEIISNEIELKDYMLNFLVYHSLDLSEYVILWKTNEPSSVLAMMEYLCKHNSIVGYTNTICSIPKKCSCNKVLKNHWIEEKRFDVTIQAVNKSYQEALELHNRILSKMKESYNVDANPHFCFGNYDYLCTFYNVTPQAFFDLHQVIYEDIDLKNAILSMNAVLSKTSYGDEMAIEKNIFNTGLIQNEFDIKTKLNETCQKIKNEFFDFFIDNELVLDGFHWRKPLSDLLILLESMSKSTVFDAVCYLFLDNAHLFLDYLKYLLEDCKSEKDFELKLVKNGIQIDKFIREWEQLAEYVVRIDGTFQRTPGYESLNHNVSSCIVEYHNAYTKCLIDYFSCFDLVSGDNGMKIASFVVPKMCRHFKTSQLFCATGKKDSMLYITIPMHELYSPFITMTSLTHEISHYCPNSLRLRDKRITSLIYCISILICDQLEIGEKSVKLECVNTLFELLKQVEQPDSNMLFLENISFQLKNLIFCMLDNTDSFQKLHSAYCNEKKYDDYQSIQIGIKMRRLASKLLFNNVNINIRSNINVQLDDIVHFFKEGYADIMMIYILSLTPSEYFSAVFSDLGLLDLPQDNGKLRMKFQRAIIVCQAMITANLWTLSECMCLNDDIYKENMLFDMFKHEYKEWLSDKLNEKAFKFYYSKEILLNIIEYLIACLNRISEIEYEFNLYSKRDTIKNYFRDMVSDNGLFSESFYSLLKENREGIINRWYERETTPFEFE